MRRIKFLSKLKLEPGTKEDIQSLYIALAAWGLCMIFLIVMTSYYIHLYSEEPIVVIGELKDVNWDHRGLEVFVDNNSYIISKSHYTKRSYGVIDNIPLGDLLTLLDEKGGREVCLEYTKTGSNHNQIVRLTIDGVNYVEKDTAISDFIGENKTMRGIGIVMLALTVVCYVLTKKGIIR